MTKHFKIICPLKVVLPRKTVPDKVYRLNLNEYRNWQYIVSNQVKSKFKEDISSQLQGITLPGKLNVTFQLFKDANRRTDKSNFYSVISKFLYDAMSELGVIEDDNDKIIIEENLLETKVDRKNPRAEFVFTIRDQ